MVVWLSRPHDCMVAKGFRWSHFRQSTALIGATLLFCLAGVGAEADTLYYNRGQNGGTPNPATDGGIWSTSSTHTVWVERDGDDYATENTRFRNRDDVHFLTPGGAPIIVHVYETVQPGDIVVERGTFEFEDDLALRGIIFADNLIVAADGTLNLDAEMTVEDAATVEGALVIREDTTLFMSDLPGGAENAIDINGGRLTVDGTIDGGVDLNADGVLTLGDGSRITGTLTVANTVYDGAGHVGGLKVEDSANVTFAGANAEVNGNVTNAGLLTLGEGRYGGRLSNSGTLALIDDVAFEDSNPAISLDGENQAGATIRVDSGNHTLSFVQNFQNDGTLQVLGTGNSLTIQSGLLTLNQGTAITGNVILSGAIRSLADLDLVHVPVLRGNFTNTIDGTATVTGDVVGNGRLFTNVGRLLVTGGDLTGLASLQNTGTVNVAAGQTLGATTISHDAGTLTSLGALAGEISSSSTAQIQGRVDGRFEVADGQTTITGALTATGGDDDRSLVVRSSGELIIADDTTVTTDNLVNDGRLVLGTTASEATDTVINGNVINSGELSGDARITGNLTLAGDSAMDFTGMLLSVDGALINDLDTAVFLRDFVGVTFGSVGNLGNLTIGDAITSNVTNDVGGTLRVNAAITGDLASYGSTTLNSDVIGQLRIVDGTTNVGPNVAGGPVLVGGGTTRELLILAEGALLVNNGDLTSSGAVRATGQVRVSQPQTLTTPRLIITGDSDSWIRGTVAGAITVAAAGQLELNGGIVTGLVTNNGRLDGADTTGRTVRLQGGLENSGVVRMSSPGRPVIITGSLRNEAAGDAEIIGNVTATNDENASVVNLGELTLTGNVAGTVENSGILELTGNANQLQNNLNGTATVDGTVGLAGAPAAFGVINRGTLNFDGTIANSLQNFGNATVDGTINGNAVNTGTLNLNGTVALQLQNNGTGATLNIIDDSQAAELVNTGTANIRVGQRLDLTSGQLTNGSGGNLNISGRVETSAASGVLALQNDAGGRLNLASGGTVAGNLANAGSAGLGGRVTGNVTNTGTGSVSLLNGARIDGSLNNQAEASLAAGVTATVVGGTSNQGELEVEGTLLSNLANTAGGTVEIIAGRVVGSVNNLANGSIISSGTITGDVTNAGTYSTDLFSEVDGDFTNDGLLTQSRNNSQLLVTGTITNNGTISAGSFADATIRINAETYVNNGTTEGSIVLDADIGNVDQLIFRGNSELLGDLSNQDNGIVRVWGNVTGTGDNIIANRGVFDVSDIGALTEVDTITNYDQFLIAAGGRVQANSVTNADGLLSSGGRIEADLSNRSGAELRSTGTIAGDLSNAGLASLAGRVEGTLLTTAAGNTTVSGALAVTGPLRNDGTMQIAQGARLTSAQTVVNGSTGTLTAEGAITGSVLNYGAAQIVGGLSGNLSNAGEALLSGAVGGALVNNSTDASSIIRVRDNVQTGSVNNQSGMFVVGAGRSLTVQNQFQNGSDGVLSLAGTVNLGSDQPLLNATGGRVALLAGSTLNGDLLNDGRANLAGTVGGSVVNRESMTGAGQISGSLTNQGGTFETGNDLVIGGEIINERAPLTGGAAQGGMAQRAAPGDPALLRVNANTTVTARGGVSNDAYSTVEVDGTLNGNLVNDGRVTLTNRLNGSLNNRGTAELEGEISRDLIFRAGSIELTGDLTVGGTFDAFQDFTIGSGRSLTAGLYNNRTDQRLTLDGNLGGAVRNAGIIDAGNGVSIGNLTNEGTVLVGNALTVQGSLVNNGRMNMQNTTVGDVLTVTGGAGGNGVYALDLDISANGGAGSSDRVVVRGGAVTGSVLLSFDAGDIEAPSDESRRILVFDVDGSQGAANSFTFAGENLPQASERIIYALVSDSQSGDLYVTDTINPALGALAGNLALTQSLIGSVVNRPTSPFVPGLATDAGDKKCGPGAWARAVAGHATATGRSRSGDVAAASEIEANYRGLQFGGDLACFENSVKGWNVALGVLGGVNDGSTTQPVFINNSTDPNSTSGLLTSINRGEFRQVYGGIYATATRDRLSLDLQVRRERTEFTIDNQPVGDNDGLQLATPDFDSNATTISGSLSYAYDLPRDGWMFVPTAGFAFSNLSVEKITFTTGDTLQIEDSKNRVGFIGGTLSKTFINPDKNSAIYAFGTATVYKDFAGDTNSVYTMVGADGSVFRTDSLSSSNLGTYGELSLGANYLKVLDTGRAGAPRQFNASIRVDGRTGDVLDSYGVTAQVRFQF
ncbi:hypothetical protein [uncultured Paracoccus sp.]|uniref:hypothetical protein n=1 Tax=uncultured Paracoccus sp. TaxID=189685 RepID=UPI00262034C8|nr:hypothetical protein [uncultured Paracoccus sp.]